MSQSSILRTCIYVITAVCVYDIYCTSREEYHLQLIERNPIAGTLVTPVTHRWKSVTLKPCYTETYVEYRTADVSRLILFKTLGMLASIVVMLWLLQWDIRLAAIVILFVVVAQIQLLWVLLS